MYDCFTIPRPLLRMLLGVGAGLAMGLIAVDSAWINHGIWPIRRIAGLGGAGRG